MNKKQLAFLVQTMVLSVAATINGNATDSEPPITEDEARTLLALRLRRAHKGLIADAAGVEVEDVIIEEPPVKAKAAKTDESGDDSDES